MSQKATNHPNQQAINAPFRAKSAGVSLVFILLVAMYYFANLRNLLPGDETIPDGAAGLIVTAVLLTVIGEIVLQIVLFVGAGQVEHRTERDDVVAARASRNAYVVLIAGTFLTIGGLFAGYTAFEMGNVLLLAFLLAEIVKFASQLVYYRRSA